MSIVLKVFRLLIDNKLDLFKKGPNRKRAIKAIIKLLIIISVTTLVLIYFMKKITILGVRMDDSMLSLVLLVTHLIAFFMSLGTIVSNLYMSKDNELLMHLP